MSSDDLRFKPLFSLHEILEWNLERRPLDKHCQATIPLRQCYRLSLKDETKAAHTTDESQSMSQNSYPKLLVCHDYGVEVKEDTYFQGYYGDGNLFQIFDWDIVDCFVYFTHERLTIPPPGWTNVAHKHGTKCLGVFLVEGTEEGLQDCLQLLSIPETKDLLIQKLVEIAQFFCFDGYLLNFEVNLKDEPNAQFLMQSLLSFVHSLRTSINATIPGSLIIWYDSITVKSEDTVCGDLDWQNCLNDGNKPLFDNSSGILINYFWKNEQLIETFSASCAYDDPQNCNVFMGIVLAILLRKTPAYNPGLDSLLGIEKIKKTQLSCGLYAPGYFYQKCSEDDDAKAYSRQFWNRMRSLWASKNVLAEFPLSTNFCSGRGQCMFVHGEKMSTQAWFNMSFQDVQPSCGYEIVTNAAFIGGSCLRLQAEDPDRTIKFFPLFDLYVEISQNTELFVSLVAATDWPIGIYFSVCFPRQNSNNSNTHHYCIVSEQDSELQDQFRKEIDDDVYLIEKHLEPIPTFMYGINALLDSTVILQWKRLSVAMDFSQLPSNKGYIYRMGIIGYSSKKSTMAYSALLGQLIILPKDHTVCSVTCRLHASNILVKSQEHREGEDVRVSRVVECQLHLQNTASQVLIFVQKMSLLSEKSPNNITYLGTTTSENGFLVKNLQITQEITILRFFASWFNEKGEFSPLSDLLCCDVTLTL